MTAHDAAVSRPTDTETRAAEVAIWLQQWVQAHGGTDKRDEGGRLHLDCYCGTYLGISYGPRDSGPPEAEALAYFRHQAADMLAAGLLVAPEQPEATTTVEPHAYAVETLWNRGTRSERWDTAMEMSDYSSPLDLAEVTDVVADLIEDGHAPDAVRIVAITALTPVTDDGEGADRG